VLPIYVICIVMVIQTTDDCCVFQITNNLKQQTRLSLSWVKTSISNMIVQPHCHVIPTLHKCTLAQWIIVQMSDSSLILIYTLCSYWISIPKSKSHCSSQKRDLYAWANLTAIFSIPPSSPIANKWTNSSAHLEIAHHHSQSRSSPELLMIVQIIQ
jgi:hypothetical protein